MRIGFDIDDTLIQLRKHAFGIYKRKLNKDFSDEIFHGIDTVEIHRPFELSDEEGTQMWQDNRPEIYFTNCPAYEHAIEVLNELVKEGHDIFYITARPKGYCKQTIEWVKELGFPVVDSQFYCGMEDHEKVEIIKDLQLDFYIDDKPKVLDTLADLSTHLIVFNQAYNQHAKYTRLYKWDEFVNIINKI